MIVLYGKGTALNNSKAVERRAKCKLITQTTMLTLIDVAKEKGAFDRVKSYWNTYHCQNKIITSGNRMYAPHCKNRFCTYCCGIRKAELINKYLPILQTWEEPYFVTLTVKAVKATRLRLMIEAINKAFCQIKGKHSKRGERGTGTRIMGLKSLECNFNPIYRTYNPHLHLIVPDKETAELLINEWLEKWTTKYTHRDAQNYRKVEDKEKDLVEVIKYETKIFTEPDSKKKKGKKGTAIIYTRALDNIYAAMKGARLIDKFGFKLPKTEKTKTEGKLVEDCMIWQYDLNNRDWLNEDHESTLAAYVPDFQLENILKSNIDKVIE